MSAPSSNPQPPNPAKDGAPKKLVFVSAPRTKIVATPSTDYDLLKINEAFQAKRKYAFVSGNDSKARREVQKHVQHDFQHKRRTLASLGPGPNPRKVIGWRYAPIAPKPSNTLPSTETSGSGSTSKGVESGTANRSSGIQHDQNESEDARMLITKYKSRNFDDTRHPAQKRGKSLPNKISLCPYCLGAGFYQLDKPCPICRGTGYSGIKHGSKESTIQDLDHLNVSPSSPLGAGQVDPFDSFPVALKPSDKKLVVHYVSYLSFLLYQLPTAAKSNPHRMIFRWALRDPVAFEGVLSIASHHMSTVSGAVDPSQKLRHETQVVGLVNRQIDTNSFTDETIYAVGALACLQTWARNLERETMHWAALMEIIKKRGGMQDVRSTSWMMEAVVYFVGVSFYCPDPSRTTSILRLVSWGGISSHYAPFYAYLLSPLKFPLSYPDAPLRRNITMTPEEVYDARHACEQFLSLLSTLQSGPARPTELKLPESLSHRLIRYFHPLSLLLKTSPKPNTPPPLARMRALEIYSSLACLLFINIALLDYSNPSYSPSSSATPSLSPPSSGSSPLSSDPDEQPSTTESKMNRYLNWLASTLEEMISFNCKAQVLMWIFWYNGGDGAAPNAKLNSQRNWLVFRMLWVCKRLERRKGMLERVWEILFRVVVKRLGASGVVDTAVGKWKERWDDEDEDELRREILGDVYAGLPLRLDERRRDGAREERDLFEALRMDALRRTKGAGV